MGGWINTLRHGFNPTDRRGNRSNLDEATSGRNNSKIVINKINAAIKFLADTKRDFISTNKHEPFGLAYFIQYRLYGNCLIAVWDLKMYLTLDNDLFRSFSPIPAIATMQWP